MAIQRYHYGRNGANTTRRNTQYFRTNARGEIVSRTAEQIGSTLLLGTEIENDEYGSDRYAEAASDIVDNMRGEYCHCEHDGSLDHGFEIVTEPMTLAAHKAAKWDEVFCRLLQEGGEASDNCGLHVHVSRAALGSDDHAKTLCVAKILELVERFQRELSCFARRDIATTDWCKPTGFGHDTSDSSRAMIRKAQHLQEWQGFDEHDWRRYHAVNLQNRSTIEFRIFAGTLEKLAFYGALALVDGLVRWCKQHTTPETHTLSFEGLVSWINDEDLTAYWDIRRAALRFY